MDKAEAILIAEKELQPYRAMGYDALAQKIGSQASFEKISDEGEPYQVEFDLFTMTGAKQTFGWLE